MRHACYIACGFVIGALAFGGVLDACCVVETMPIPAGDYVGYRTRDGGTVGVEPDYVLKVDPNPGADVVETFSRADARFEVHYRVQP